MATRQDLLMQGLSVLVQIAVLALSGFLIDGLIAKTGQTKFRKLLDYARIGVAAAEQTFGAGNGDQKKAQVEEFLSNKLKGKLSPTEIDKLIEAAVFEMNSVIKNKVTQLDIPPDVAKSEPETISIKVK